MQEFPVTRQQSTRPLAQRHTKGHRGVHIAVTKGEPAPTWVHGVAGDLGALQASGQLAGVQHVGQFAVTVVLEGREQPRGRPAQALGVQAAGAVGAGGHDEHPAGSAALQPLQQQLRQQEMAQVVHLEGEAEAVLCRAPSAHSCGGSRQWQLTVVPRGCTGDLGARHSPALLMRRCRWGSWRRKVLAKALTERRLARFRCMNCTSLFPVSCGRSGAWGRARGGPRGVPCPGWAGAGACSGDWIWPKGCSVHGRQPPPWYSLGYLGVSRGAWGCPGGVSEGLFLRCAMGIPGGFLDVPMEVFWGLVM